MDILEKTINIFGVPFVLAKKQEVGEWCKARIEATQKTVIVTANPEILLKARRDPWFKDVIREADVITPDGSGVCWAAIFSKLADKSDSWYEIFRLFARTLWQAVLGRKNSGGDWPERVSGADLLWDIVKFAEPLSKTVYLIGGRRGTAKRAAFRIKNKYKKIRVDAFDADHIATPYSSYQLHNEITIFQPDIIFVAYGSPKQDEWINQNMHRYPSVMLMMGVGGALDIIAGNTDRAPLKLQNHALEWFWRLYQRPSRIVRVLRAVIVFPLIILASQLKKHYVRKFRKQS